MIFRSRRSNSCDSALSRRPACRRFNWRNYKFCETEFPGSLCHKGAEIRTGFSYFAAPENRALRLFAGRSRAVRSARFSASVRKFHSSFEITQCPRILVRWGCRFAVFATQVAARLLCLVIRLTSHPPPFSDRCQHWEIA